MQLSMKPTFFDIRLTHRGHVMKEIDWFWLLCMQKLEAVTLFPFVIHLKDHLTQILLIHTIMTTYLLKVY